MFPAALLSMVCTALFVLVVVAHAALPLGVERSFKVVPPDVVKRKRTLTPTAKPSPDEVERIAALERRRFGGPSITGRIACESRMHWNATNGQYRGLLQIGSVWGYLYGGAPRNVRLRSVEHRRRPVRAFTVYEDGQRHREVIRRKRQKVITVRRGRLPANADPYHGWASLRVGQLAVSGGRTTAWSCGL